MNSQIQPGPAARDPQARGAGARGAGDGPRAPGRPAAALSHPLRAALLGLLAGRATLTATEAARELGESSGACSFHLRQLARYGQVEEVPVLGGRSRPWRLPLASGQPAGSGPADEEFGALARELENEGYRRWLAGRDSAPEGWHDAAFSTVMYLTPDELAEAAAAVRAVLAEFGRRRGGVPGDTGPGSTAPGCTGPGSTGGAGEQVLPVGVVARLFPLLPAGPDA